MFRKRADGTGNAEELWTNPGGVAFPEGWVPDVTQLLFSGQTGSAVDIRVLSLDGERSVDLLLQTGSVAAPTAPR